MRIAARFTFVLAGLLPLAGCGQYLGSYSVESVRVVTEMPKSDFGTPTPSYGQYLEIRVASSTSLTSIGRTVDGVYLDSDFCPIRNKNALIAFGPFSDDGRDLSLPSDASPVHVGSDGLFRYRLYVAVASAADQAAKPGQIQLPTYDLHSSDHDLCLRLFAPGYNLIKSRSETIRVPAHLVSAALKRGVRSSRLTSAMR
jgi:hypothetical protein